MAALERYGVTNDMVVVLQPSTAGIPCTESDICDMATELQFNHHITTINFTGIRVGVEAATALGKAIGPESRSIVQYVKLSHCQMTAEAMEGFVSRAKGNRRLEIIDVSGNSLRDDGALHLAKLVEDTPTIRVLEAAECKIGPLGASAIAGCVANHRRVTTLNLANNKLREAGTVAIAKGLSENATVTVLDLGGNSINCEGGMAIAEMLRKNKTIESINLRNNFISDSVPHVALALSQRGTPARVVDLSRNRVTNTICRTMSQVLEGQRFNMACLAMEGNPIGDDGFVALFHALRGTNLQFLDLSDTTVTAASGVVVADLIRACPILNSLQIDNNKLGDAAVTEIAHAFRESASMASLNVERTGISGVGCAALAEAFEAQGKLRSVNMAENHALTPDDVKILLAALATLRTVERVDLSDLNLPDSEDLLRSLIAVFARNEHLEYVLLQHNPMASGFEDGRLDRTFALQLADGRSLHSFLTIAGATPSEVSASRHQTIHDDSAASAAAAGSIGSRVAGGALVVASNNNDNKSSSHALASFRSAWATIRPMEHKKSVVEVADSGLDEIAEDGRVPPLIPHPQSLHHTLYPGYGQGRLCNTHSISTMSNPVSYTVDNSKGHKLPLELSADMKTFLRYPPCRPLKHSPYSLISLEMNVGGLLVTEDQLKRKFKELDVDGNGYLHREEFMRAYLAYQNFGAPVSDKKLQETMRMYDLGHRDRLFFDEFSILMLKLAQR